jgi:hypothetical protein
MGNPRHFAIHLPSGKIFLGIPIFLFLRIFYIYSIKQKDMALQDGFVLLKPIGHFKKGKVFESFGGLVSGVAVGEGTQIKFSDPEWFRPKKIKAPKSHRIEGKEVSLEDIGTPVTYIPDHAEGDASHPDSERGFISSFNERWIFVRFYGPNGQACDPKNLVWG